MLPYGPRSRFSSTAVINACLHTVRHRYLPTLPACLPQHYLLPFTSACLFTSFLRFGYLRFGILGFCADFSPGVGSCRVPLPVLYCLVFTSRFQVHVTCCCRYLIVASACLPLPAAPPACTGPACTSLTGCLCGTSRLPFTCCLPLGACWSACRGSPPPCLPLPAHVSACRYVALPPFLPCADLTSRVCHLTSLPAWILPGYVCCLCRLPLASIACVCRLPRFLPPAAGFRFSAWVPAFLPPPQVPLRSACLQNTAFCLLPPQVTGCLLRFTRCVRSAACCRYALPRWVTCCRCLSPACCLSSGCLRGTTLVTRAS